MGLIQLFIDIVYVGLSGFFFGQLSDMRYTLQRYEPIMDRLLEQNWKTVSDLEEMITHHTLSAPEEDNRENTKR